MKQLSMFSQSIDWSNAIIVFCKSFVFFYSNKWMNYNVKERVYKLQTYFIIQF